MVGEVPPPGAGFNTATLAVPAVAISAAVIVGNCVPLAKVVAFEAPLNVTTDVATNPVPFTVSVKATPPAVALVGETEAAVGAGFLIVKI